MWRVRACWAQSACQLGGPHSAWPRKQFGRLNVERYRKPVDYINRYCVKTALQGADIGPIDLGLISQIFLRHACGATCPPEICCEYFADVHPREQEIMSIIQPRSILDKIGTLR